MENSSVLDEQKYQKTSKSLRIFGLVLIICGALAAASFAVVYFLAVSDYNSDLDKQISDKKAEIDALVTKYETPREGGDGPLIPDDVMEEKLKTWLSEQTEKLETEKERLINEGVELDQFASYDSGDAYTLKIISNALNPGFEYCGFDEYKNNEWTESYCNFKNQLKTGSYKTENDTSSSFEKAKEEAQYKFDKAKLEGELSMLESKSGSGNIENSKFLMFAGLAGGFPIVIGIALLAMGSHRKIMAYGVQSAMPIAKDVVREMQPTMTEAKKKQMQDMAPAYGKVAKEVAKGVKEGMKEADASETGSGSDEADVASGSASTKKSDKKK